MALLCPARARGQRQRLPAIALTALARHEDRLQALQAGFHTHVAKPVKLAELVIVLAGIARLYQQKRP